MMSLSCILLIDDDEITNFINRRVIERTLKVPVVAITDAEKGLSYLTSETSSAERPQPGLIMLDLNMPGMTGWDFLDAYRALPEETRSRAVVMVLTTSENPEDAARASSIPEVARFCTKPLTEELLRDVVGQHFSVA